MKMKLLKICATLVIVLAAVGLFMLMFGANIMESYQTKVCTVETTATIVGFRYEPLRISNPREYVQLQCEYYVDGQKYVEYESGQRHNGLGFFSANMDKFIGREVTILYNPDNHSRFVISKIS